MSYINNTNSVSAASTSQQNNTPQVNIMDVLYVLMATAAELGQKATLSQAKVMQSNMSAQNNLISEANAINFTNFSKSQLEQKEYHWGIVVESRCGVEFPDFVKGSAFYVALSISQQALDAFSMKNEEVSDLRNNLTNGIGQMQQISQIQNTNLNTSVNAVQQSVGEASGLMGMLTSITNQIERPV